jgi:hypothetical protein
MAFGPRYRAAILTLEGMDRQDSSNADGLLGGQARF